MNGPVAITSVIFLIFLILFFNNITTAVGGAVVSIFSPVRAREYKDDPSFKRSSLISFLIAIPLFAFCLVTCKITSLNFFSTVLVLVVFTLTRYLTDALLAGLDSSYKVMEEASCSNNSFVVVSILSIPAVIYFLLVEPSSNILSLIWIGGLSTFFVIIRYFALLRKFFTMKFSRFFTFLYLCGLKILPIAVAVKVLVY